MVPLAGAVHVLSTQVLVPAFGIGSGVPKLQPVLVQSGSALLRAGACVVAPMVQMSPSQLSANRLTEPSGVGPWATNEPPPPMFRPPQVRHSRTVAWASCAEPQMRTGAPSVKSSVKQLPVHTVVVVVVEVAVV